MGVQDSAQTGGRSMGWDLWQRVVGVQLQQVAHSLETCDEAAGGVALWVQGEGQGAGRNRMGGRVHLGEVMEEGQTRCEHFTTLHTPGLHGSQDARHGERKHGRGVGYGCPLSEDCNEI